MKNYSTLERISMGETFKKSLLPKIVGSPRKFTEGEREAAQYAADMIASLTGSFKNSGRKRDEDAGPKALYFRMRRADKKVAEAEERGMDAKLIRALRREAKETRAAWEASK
jgi:hypothetical protein